MTVVWPSMLFRLSRLRAVYSDLAGKIGHAMSKVLLKGSATVGGIYGDPAGFVFINYFVPYKYPFYMFYLWPWTYMALHCFTLQHVCSNATLRQFPNVNEFCTDFLWRPSKHQVSWYLVSWEARDAADDTWTLGLPLHMAQLVDGAQGLNDSFLTVDHQLSKLVKDTTSVGMMYGVAPKLRKSWPKPLEAKISNTFHSKAPFSRSMIALISDINTFMRVFCEEKDRMSEEYRTFVDFYISVLARDLNSWANPFWAIAIPPLWIFQSINYHAEVSFLPTPNPHAFQAQSEVRFLARRLRKVFFSSLDTIAAAVPKVDGPALVTAKKSVMAYQEELESSILESKPWFWQSPTVKHEELLERHRLTQRILTTIDLMQRIAIQCLENVTRLIEGLSYIRDGFETLSVENMADTGTVWLLAHFRSHLMNPDRPWLKAVGSQGPIPGSKNGTDDLTQYELNFRLLERSDVPVLRSILGDLCKKPLDRGLGKGGLYTICFIQNFSALYADLDANALEDIPLSWQVQRFKVAQRQRAAKAVDLEAWIPRLLEDYKARQRETQGRNSRA
ncbi:MAG: hypothetical protein Q9169_007342 [Polycauliona sp. 2 TL-2023]